MYTDVQQLKMVQMVSQSQFFRNFYLPSLMRLPICLKTVRNFKQNFAQLGRQPLKIFYNAAALDAIVLYVPGNANVLSFLLFMV